MIRIKQYITLFLLEIYLFPLLFQPIHTALHGLQKHHAIHQLCNLNTSIVFLETQDESISNQEDICPICNYQFVIVDITKISTFESVMRSFFCRFEIGKAKNPKKLVFETNSPRAPPLSIA